MNQILKWVTGSRDPNAPGPGKKRINLALQGGGAHGAFTWGVLDHLLEDGRLIVDGISGASAGALNGLVLADGLARGGPAEARKRLAEFWRAASFGGNMPDMQRQVVERMFSVVPLSDSPMKAWLEAMGRFMSPYELNPLNLNPLREVIEKFVDFEKVRATGRDLFISATNVQSGNLRVFTREELTCEVAMASACLPFLFQAVEIDGVPYWDGGYTGNPALFPFLRATQTEDILLVQIYPLTRQKAPTTKREIMGRTHEITFNAPLMAELRALEDSGRLIEEGKLPRGTGVNEYRRLRMHRIHLDDMGDTLNDASRLKNDYEFFDMLHKLGQRAARRFLDAHFDDIGTRATIDLSAEEAAKA
jgi:NTE family protein